MTWRRRVGSELGSALLAVALFLFGCTQADAAYRLIFRNGTSLEVKSYDDLGDSISYQRFGGAVVVPKAQVTAIQEVPSPAPAPPGPAPRPPSVAPPNVTQGIHETSRPPVNPPVSSPAPLPRSSPARSSPVNLISPFTMLSGALTILGSFIIFMLVVLGVLYWRRTHFFGKTADRNDLLPYEKRPSLLSAAERSFYGILCQAAEQRYSIFAKVRLGDLLEIPRGTPKFRNHLSRINRKHVDFVLCDPNSLTPLLVIELDDSSHEREDRQERDAFVDAALDAAGLPIVHVSAQHAYAPAEVRALITDRLTGGP